MARRWRDRPLTVVLIKAVAGVPPLGVKIGGLDGARIGRELKMGHYHPIAQI